MVSMESTLICVFNLRNPMSEANQICDICGIRVICESLGSAATLIREDTARMVICVICVICETFPEISLINPRDFILSARNLRICGICVRPF